MSNINVPYDDYGEEHYGQNGNGRAQQLYAQQANGAYQPQGRYANGAGGRQVVSIASAPAKQQNTVKTGAQASSVVASGENGGANGANATANGWPQKYTVPSGAYCPGAMKSLSLKTVRDLSSIPNSPSIDS